MAESQMRASARIKVSLTPFTQPAREHDPKDRVRVTDDAGVTHYCVVEDSWFDEKKFKWTYKLKVEGTGTDFEEGLFIPDYRVVSNSA